MNVVSNQYKLRLTDLHVLQYELEIKGMDIWDANLMQRIMRYKRTALEQCLGQFVVSGKAIYSLQELENDFSIDVCLKDTKYTIFIGVSSQTRVHLSSNFSNEENSVDQTMINIIIKQAFRDTNLK